MDSNLKLIALYVALFILGRMFRILHNCNVIYKIMDYDFTKSEKACLQKPMPVRGDAEKQGHALL